MLATGSPAVIVRPGALSVMAAGDVVTFDLEGRPVAACLAGRTFWRGLDGRVVEKRGPRDRRTVRRLDDLERDAWLARLRALVGVAAARADLRGRAILERAAAFDAAADAARFRALYSPVGILPPDQYLAVVLQATVGCPWNRCTFCEFYRGVPYRVASPEAFAAHAAAVRAFLGEGVRLRRTVFLGDANALAIPAARLEAHLRTVRETFALVPEGLAPAAAARYRRAHPGALRGIHAFVDAFAGRRHAPADLETFRGLGLRRVYVGLETGDDGLLAFLRKRGTAADAVDAVRAFRAAGIAVGVIVMLGIGGDRFARAHAARTAAVVSAMRLGAGDILYFSPLVVPLGTEYRRLAAAAGIRDLTGAEIRAQRREILAGSAFAGPAPAVATYDVREFIY